MDNPLDWQKVTWSRLSKGAPAPSPAPAPKAARFTPMSSEEKGAPGGFKSLWAPVAPEPLAQDEAVMDSQKLEELLAQAREQGREEGYAQAQAEISERSAQAEALLESLAKSVSQAARSAEAALDQTLAERVANMGLQIARSVFGPIEQPGPEGWSLLLDALTEELRSAAGPAELYAHPLDLPNLEAALALLPAHEQQEISARGDSQLERGSARMARGPFGAETSFDQRLASITERLAPHEPDAP